MFTDHHNTPSIAIAQFHYWNFNIRKILRKIYRPSMPVTVMKDRNIENNMLYYVIIVFEKDNRVGDAGIISK